MKSLVIGANGFLGSNLINKLIDKGHKVTGVFNQNKSRVNPLAITVSFEDIKKLDAQEFDFIFYASGSFSSSYDQLIKINCLDLKMISDYFNTAKLIYISSINVYGDVSETIREDTSFNNPNTYGLSKIAGEFIARNHPKFAIIRPCYLYGPKLDNRSFLPGLIDQVKAKSEIVLFGQGSREQDYLYIDDASELCYLAAINDGNDIFLGATGKSYSNQYIANLIRMEDPSVKLTNMGQEFGKSIYLNPENTFTKLKWKPSTGIQEGIKNMWYASFD